jgi:hypothetical protein
LLPSGWDRDIGVSDDGWHVLITSITPELMLDAKMPLYQQNVDKQNVFVDYLQGAMDKKRNQEKRQAFWMNLKMRLSFGISLLRCEKSSMTLKVTSWMLFMFIVKLKKREALFAQSGHIYSWKGSTFVNIIPSGKIMSVIMARNRPMLLTRVF